jgi:hypothetical protein
MQFTLLDGRTVAMGDIVFNPAIHHFYLGNEDITGLLKRADKLQFDGFDTETENSRLYVEKYIREHNGALPPEIGSTSVWWQFKELLINDPLGAPLDALDSGISKLWSSTGIKVIVAAVAVLVVVVLVVKFKR